MKYFSMVDKINSTSRPGQIFEALNMHTYIMYLLKKPLWTPVTALTDECI